MFTLTSFDVCSLSFTSDLISLIFPARDNVVSAMSISNPTVCHGNTLSDSFSGLHDRGVGEWRHLPGRFDGFNTIEDAADRQRDQPCREGGPPHPRLSGKSMPLGLFPCHELRTVLRTVILTRKRREFKRSHLSESRLVTLPAC